MTIEDRLNDSFSEFTELSAMFPALTTSEKLVVTNCINSALRVVKGVTACKKLSEGGKTCTKDGSVGNACTRYLGIPCNNFEKNTL